MAQNWKDHERGDRIKWAVVFTVVLAVIVGVLAVFSDGFRNWDIKTWKIESGVTSASAASENPSISFTVDESGNYVIINSYPETYADTNVTLITSYLKKDGTQIASAIWCRSYPDVGPNFAANVIPIATVFTNKTGIGNDYSYETLPVENGTYTLSFDYYYETRAGKTMYSNEITFTIGASQPLPETPTREGYTFTGWYFDEACTQPYDGSPIYEDTTLYAGWQINTYTVTFNSNGGTNVSAITVNWNTTPELPTPTREGHTFLGWFKGDSLYDNSPITVDTTLTAQWQINTYTVTFMSNGEVFKTVTVEWGSSFQTVMNANALAYYNVYANGVKLSKATPVKTDMTVEVEEMSGQEKAATFIAKNWWVLIVGGAVVAIGTAAIVCAVMRKRG